MSNTTQSLVLNISLRESQFIVVHVALRRSYMRAKLIAADIIPL